MTKIYMVRHCEAMGNVQRLFQGKTDLDISELGAIQLKFLSNRFKELELHKIYSSPLLRAKKTAEAIKGNKSLSIELCDGLAELDGGVLDGKPFKESFLSIPGLLDIWDNHPQDFAPENGEAMKDAYERIWNAVISIARENKDKTIACASHGGVIRCLNCRILSDDITQLKNIEWSENTAVTLIEFDDNYKPTIVFRNDVSHLPSEYLNAKTRLGSFMVGDKK